MTSSPLVRAAEQRVDRRSRVVFLSAMDSPDIALRQEHVLIRRRDINPDPA